MIIYNKLFALLAMKGMKKTDLRPVITSSTLAKLGKNESITTDTVERICMFLECQPGDIMQVVSDYQEIGTGRTATYKYKELMFLNDKDEQQKADNKETVTGEATSLIFNNLSEQELKQILHN